MDNDLIDPDSLEGLDDFPINFYTDTTFVPPVNKPILIKENFASPFYPLFEFDTIKIISKPPESLCGDTNDDTDVNIADAIYLISYIFNGGPSPAVLKTGDTNSDGSVDVSDVVYIINYVFNNGTPPCVLDNDGSLDNR